MTSELGPSSLLCDILYVLIILFLSAMFAIEKV